MRRFLVDNRLPVALARWIEGKGDFAEHVMALDFGHSSDLAFWERAATEGA